MKRYPELFKKILIEYEKLPLDGTTEMFVIDGYTPDEIFYHQQLLNDAGYIVANIDHYIGGDYDIYAKRLTNDGHEFLDAARNETNWNKVKDILGKSGGFVLEIAKDLLITYSKNQLGL